MGFIWYSGFQKVTEYAGMASMGQKIGVKNSSSIVSAGWAMSR